MKIVKACSHFPRCGEGKNERGRETETGRERRDNVRLKRKRDV